MQDLINDLGYLGEINIIRDANDGTGYSVHLNISRIEIYEDEIIIYDDNGSSFSLPVNISYKIERGSLNETDGNHEYRMITPYADYYITIIM